MIRSSRSLLSWGGLAAYVLFAPLSARGETPGLVEHVEIRGTHRTQSTTLLDLLPRPPPAPFTEAEILEVERRISNLEIFDDVHVEREGDTLRIDVREKWTLIPSFDFATGSSARDLFLSLGATEFNLQGRAAQLGVLGAYEERGFSFGAGFAQHEYHPRRWAFGFEVHHETSDVRFDDDKVDGNPVDGNPVDGDKIQKVGWSRRTVGGSMAFTAPAPIGSFVRYVVGAAYDRETVIDPVTSVHPRGGHVAGTYMMFTWDHFTWNDLVPSGFKVRLSLEPNWLLGPALPESRHAARLAANGALPLGAHTVLAVRANGDVTTRGNPNYSSLVGSVAGVRGLDDAFYRNWLQGYVNVELRHALPIAERWALQGVLFSDVARFERLDSNGRRDRAVSALNLGAGVRVVPTFLARLLVRVDVARLLLPDAQWFFQFGVSQYF